MSALASRKSSFAPAASPRARRRCFEIPRPTRPRSSSDAPARTHRDNIATTTPSSRRASTPMFPSRPRRGIAPPRARRPALTLTLVLFASSLVVSTFPLGARADADDDPFEDDSYDPDDELDYGEALAPAGAPEGAPVAPGPEAAPEETPAPDDGFPEGDWVNSGVVVNFLRAEGGPAFSVGRAGAPEMNIRVALDSVAELDEDGKKVRAIRPQARTWPPSRNRLLFFPPTLTTTEVGRQRIVQISPRPALSPRRSPVSLPPFPPPSPRRYPRDPSTSTSSAAPTPPRSPPPPPPPSSATHPSSPSSST